VAGDGLGTAPLDKLRAQILGLGAQGPGLGAHCVGNAPFDRLRAQMDGLWAQEDKLRAHYE